MTDSHLMRDADAHGDIERANALLASIAGGEFTTLLASYTVQLHIECEGVTRPIQTGQAFTLHGPDGDCVVDPEDNPQSVAHLLPLLRKARVSSVKVTEPATLNVEFDTGHSFSVPANDHYEAWDVAGSDGSFIVATPGGGLSIWVPNQ